MKKEYANAAKEIRDKIKSRSAKTISEHDQAVAAICDAWKLRGIDLKRPESAEATFCTLGWCFSTLLQEMEESSSPNETIQNYGDLLTGAIVALSEYVPES